MDNNTIQTEVPKEQEVKQPVDKPVIKINKKTAIIIAAVIILIALIYVFRGLFVAAIVNGSPISRLSVISKLEKTSGRNLLDSLITEKLIQNEAKAKKLVISSEEINGEIKKIEDQVVSQGGTLNEALAAQGMSQEDLKTQINIQLELEKLVSDKISVTDQEVAKYISDNKISISAGQEATSTEQIKNELKNQKVSQEANALITTLKSQARINYFVNY